MKVTRSVETWGTVILLEACNNDKSIEFVGKELDKAERFLKEIDKVFSTYKETSEVSLLRKGLLSIDEASSLVKEVWSLCEYARTLTNGAFDPWAVKDGFDPSGLVKGWAAEKVVSMLRLSGLEHILVNASGDIFVTGGRGVESGNIKPWVIGIADPSDPQEIVKVFEVMGGCIATSGTYQNGSHIKDPHTGLIAIGAKSATVLGPNGALSDALATALIVDGDAATDWIFKPELQDYSFWVVNRHENTAWSHGKNKGYTETVMVNNN